MHYVLRYRGKYLSETGGSYPTPRTKLVFRGTKSECQALIISNNWNHLTVEIEMICDNRDLMHSPKGRQIKCT